MQLETTERTALDALLEQPVDCKECGARVRVADIACPGCDAYVCRVCGCTEHTACEGPCGWVDETRRLCSSCKPPASRST